MVRCKRCGYRNVGVDHDTWVYCAAVTEELKPALVSSLIKPLAFIHFHFQYERRVACSTLSGKQGQATLRLGRSQEVMKNYQYLPSRYLPSSKYHKYIHWYNIASECFNDNCFLIYTYLTLFQMKYEIIKNLYCTNMKVKMIFG